MIQQQTVSSSEGLSQTSAPKLAMDQTDSLFSILYIFLGIALAWTLTSDYYVTGMKVFSLLFVGSTLCYINTKNISLSKESIFWLAVTVFIGFSYSGNSVAPILQLLAWGFAGSYSVLCCSSALKGGGTTSSWLPIDICSALFILPYGNFGCQGRIALSSAKKSNQGKHLVGIFIGMLMSLPILVFVLYQLAHADIRFGKILMDIISIIDIFPLLWIWRLALAAFFSAAMFGQIYGAIHKRRSNVISEESVHKMNTSMRCLPNTAAYTVLILVLLCYGLFIFIQGSHLFSAFVGHLPEGFTMAEYARQGFFELCRIVGFNGLLLLILNTLCVTNHRDSKILRILNTVMAFMTLLLIATAMSKMIFYISSFGFTAKRVITSAFMIWMFLSFIYVIIWQKKKINITKWSFITGAVVYCGVCILPHFVYVAF